MSAKTLKLAFAMGGGVSLGAFSGAALTEAIKLALLRIAECRLNKIPLDYDRVEIDVFSGASAGSLSLAVMLRGLTWRTQEEGDAATARLAKDYPTLWAEVEKDPDLKDDLVAAQVAQDLQKRAWVEKIDISQLLGNGDSARRDALRHGPGLLDGEAVYSIARELLIEGVDQVKWNRRLLSDRCLYACTLTSLTALTADSRLAYGADQASMAGLRDALVSRFHNDMRVFDIHFKDTLKAEEAKKSEEQASALAEVAAIAASDPAKKLAAAVADLAVPTLPPRWYRLHRGDKEAKNVALPLLSKETWAKIASTAIASGAFPAAFPPVILERKSWEYGFRKGKPADDPLNRASTWPKLLKEKDVDQHPFAYVDGGVFNNDPVREAYRMVSFMDGDDSPTDFIRRVLFVDPSVGPEGEKFRVEALNEFGTKEDAKFTNFGSPAPTVRLTTLPRLMGMVGGLVSIVLEQGRSREADGVLTTRDNFALRARFREGAKNLLQSIPAEALQGMATPFWAQLNEGCKLILNGWANQLIPVGAGNIAGELQRILREESLSLEMIADADKYAQHGPDFTGLRGDPGDWLRVHLALYFDLVLGLEGKRDSAKLIAITPYRDLTQKVPEPLKLLGAPISAFVGFFSRTAREHDFLAGRFCADLFLKHDAENGDRRRLLPESVEGRLINPPERRALRQSYGREIALWAPRFKDRLEEVLEGGLPGIAAPIVPWLLKKVIDIDKAVEDLVEERFSDTNPGETDEAMSIELIVLVPTSMERLEIARGGHGMADEPVRKLYVFGEVRSVLATSVRFEPAGSKRPAAWHGGAVRDGNHICIDKDGFNLGHWAILELPSPDRWGKLAAIARTHLRPVLKLDLTKLPAKGKHKVTADSEEWKIGEAAIPLVDTLLGKTSPPGGTPA